MWPQPPAARQDSSDAWAADIADRWRTMVAARTEPSHGPDRVRSRTRRRHHRAHSPARRPAPPCAQYEAGSAPALALKATIERTEKRFASYGKAGLLCGADGLPHLIADPGLALRYGHAGEVFVSGPRRSAA
jgi:hypothetical protein